MLARSMAWRQIPSWPPRRWLVAALVAAAVALVIGVPTGLVSTTFYTRMTPITWWSWPVWVATAVMSGLLAATYVRTPIATRGGARTGTGGGVLGLLAVGCPVCNKIVVLVVGLAGATQWWAPVQPIIGTAGLGLLGYALWTRLHAEVTCTLPTRPAQPQTQTR